MTEVLIIAFFVRFRLVIAISWAPEDVHLAHRRKSDSFVAWLPGPGLMIREVYDEAIAVVGRVVVIVFIDCHGAEYKTGDVWIGRCDRSG
jgi:hypothetical protein